MSKKAVEHGFFKLTFPPKYVIIKIQKINKKGLDLNAQTCYNFSKQAGNFALSACLKIYVNIWQLPPV